MTDETPLIRILSVDDHPLLRSGIGALIATQPDMQLVAEAANGKEAVQLYREFRPDVTLMDLQMPKMDGLEATAAIRQLPGYQDVPILALTANYSDEIRQQCQQNGMQGFLSKPVSKVALWSEVSRWLNLSE